MPEQPVTPEQRAKEAAADVERIIAAALRDAETAAAERMREACARAAERFIDPKHWEVLRQRSADTAAHIRALPL